jgi:potassium-transporting ATPase potassium-binding subunit
MNIYGWLQLILYMAVLLLLAKPLGTYMAHVYQGERTFLDPVLRPVERLLYRAGGVHAEAEMNWTTYAVAMLLFNVIGLVVVSRLVCRRPRTASVKRS